LAANDVIFATCYQPVLLAGHDLLSAVDLAHRERIWFQL
jgi:hypothetical protein